MQKHILDQETSDLQEQIEHDSQMDQVRPEHLLIMYQFEKCPRCYRRNDAYATHKENRSSVQAKTMVFRHFVIALSILGKSDAPIYTTKDSHPETLDVTTEDIVRHMFALQSGWA